MKSAMELDLLVTEVLTQEDFNQDELSGFRTTTEMKRMDNATTDTFSGFDGWTNSSVSIWLPAGDSKKGGTEEDAPQLDIPQVWHRDITSVIKSTWEDDVSRMYHSTPYREFFKPAPDKEAMRVFGEAYTANVFLELD